MSAARLSAPYAERCEGRDFMKTTPLLCAIVAMAALTVAGCEDQGAGPYGYGGPGGFYTGAPGSIGGPYNGAASYGGYPATTSQPQYAAPVGYAPQPGQGPTYGGPV